MIQIERNGIRWEHVPECQQLLDKLLADAGQPVKQTPTKLVTTHRIEDRTFYVKRYLNSGVPLRSFKYFFKQSEARNEWKLAQHYESLGIPIVRHLALGERWTATGLQESILITEGFAGVPLSKTRIHQTESVQIALAKLLRLMHDRGVLQPDLHHNILVRTDPLELRRIDVNRGELKSALTDQERIENLAWLNVAVPLTERFFETYGANADSIAKIKQCSAIMRRESRAKMARRCLGDNLRFAPVKSSGQTWYVRKEFLNDALRRVLENPGQPTTTFTVRKFEKAGRLRSPALRAYQTAYHLELLGIPTPRPVAGSRRYVVTERVEGTPTRPDDGLIAQLRSEGFAGDQIDAVKTIDGRLLVTGVEHLNFRLPD